MICKKLRKQRFQQNNSQVERLPEIDSRGLYLMLKKKGMEKEGKRFYNEGIVGKEFISLMSNCKGLPILLEDLQFTMEQIEKLMQLYMFIFKLRRIQTKKTNDLERPYYWH